MLRYFIIAVGLLIGVSVVKAGEAGRIVFVAGQAHIADRAASLGDAVQEGDELTTGKDGYVYLKTVDHGFLILRPGSHARVVTYFVDKVNPANSRIKLELLSGVARTISGQAVKQARHNFRFNTPVAAIGVRGTDFTVFTDQHVSRVTVLSGGVVVSGFSNGCGPEGAGPCEGNTSRELFAEQTGQLLQVQRGQTAPQLLRSNGLSPDLNAPPRKDEPVGKAVGEDFSLDPQKSEDILSGSLLPPPPPPPPAAPKPPEVLWGRWEAVANLPADPELLAKLRNGTYLPASILRSFFVSRVKESELVLPREGRAAFGLVNSEAYIRAANQAPVPAAIQDARLEIDFATRAFTTGLTVVAPGHQVEIHAKGDVTLKGELVNSIFGSNASVRGYLGGADAKEAGYIFSSIGTPAVGAFGATQWVR